MSKATSQAFSSYRRNRTVLSFRERYRLTVFVSNGTVAVMAQRGVSLKSVLTCYEKNKIIFFFIWAVIDFMTINISWFLLNIKQHPSPISRKPQTVLNGWMAWIVCIVLFSYHKCTCPMSRAIAATFWPRGRRALRARRPRGPNVKKSCQELDIYRYYRYKQFDDQYGFSISIGNTSWRSCIVAVNRSSQSLARWQWTGLCNSLTQGRWPELPRCHAKM